MEPDLEKYLAPVSEDLMSQAQVASAAKMAIESELEQEKPDWGRVEREARLGLDKSRSVHLGVALLVCLARSRGPVGLRDGLELLRRWTVDLWPRLLPELDTQETDRTEQARRRLRLFKGMGSSKSGEPFRVHSHLLLMPVFPETNFTFRAFPVVDGGEGFWQESQILEAWEGCRERDPEAFAATEPALEGCLAALEGLSKALAEQLGADPGLLAPSNQTEASPAPWDPMRDRLQTYLRCVRRLSLNGNAGSSEPVPASQPVGLARPSPELEFTSRGAAILALRRSLEFLQSSEPTSPVVFLLHYALEVADRPFLGLYGDWASPELTTLKDKLGLEEAVMKRLSAAAPHLAVPVADETTPIILSRDDALRALRSISAYFVANDRSNPVPTILNQALELSGLSFGEIWARFAPEQIGEIRYILGAPRPPKEVSP